MSESTTTSEGTASTDAGAGDGTGAPDPTPTPTPGAQPDAGALAADLEAANRRARDEQSRADRLKAELARLQAAGGTPDPDPKPASTGLTVDQFRAELRRAREFDLATAALKDEFKMADAGLFSDPADRFDSVEAFRAAAEESHRSIEDRVKAREAEIEAQLRARYAERYGPLEPDAPDATTPTGDGLPTPEQLARMSIREMDALEAKHPGVIDRIIASATRKDV